MSVLNLWPSNFQVCSIFSLTHSITVRPCPNWRLQLWLRLDHALRYRTSLGTPLETAVAVAVDINLVGPNCRSPVIYSTDLWFLCGWARIRGATVGSWLKHGEVKCNTERLGWKPNSSDRVRCRHFVSELSSSVSFTCSTWIVAPLKVFDLWLEHFKNTWHYW